MVTLSTPLTRFPYPEMVALGRRVVEQRIDQTLSRAQRNALDVQRTVADPPPQLSAPGAATTKPYYFLVNSGKEEIQKTGISSDPIGFYDSQARDFVRRSHPTDDWLSFSSWPSLHDIARWLYDNRAGFNATSPYVLEIAILGTQRRKLPANIHRDLHRKRGWSLLDGPEQRHLEDQWADRDAEQRQRIKKLTRGSGANENDEFYDSEFIWISTNEADEERVRGSVVRGKFKGRNLIDLSTDELLELRSECMVDPDSLKLCEWYLDYINPDGWKDSADQSTGRSGMTLKEAYEMLCVKPTDDDKALRAAFKRRKFQTHPDNKATGSNEAFLSVTQAIKVICESRPGN